ncbi:hypothetical protein CLU96_1275 [Chryseobacterium sp. 52]|uniref:hypothetical protein n=1 Tax=Chryseobacterium sp. 52 TaxID=2035213 RepID=UPI000C19B0D4|nr:hypothetical protein [Chryseobacterium sp. 52]PIF44331.1 hypothetical protein CLU96_1275 [Chryseobacterium sp. 52]
MIFDTSNPDMRKKAIDRVKNLLEKKAKIEVLEKRRNRTYSQNNYLHLILGWYALEYGDTLEEIKQEHFKRIVNRDLFITEFINYKTGEVRERWRSTTELDTKEMSTAIERFRNYSVKTLNIYLPEPKDLVHLEEIENQLEQYHNKIYL